MPAPAPPLLMISQDLDEIFEIADRIAVLSDGRLSPLYAAETMTADRIGMLMGGVHHEHDGLRTGRGAACGLS